MPERRIRWQRERLRSNLRRVVLAYAGGVCVSTLGFALIDALAGGSARNMFAESGLPGGLAVGAYAIGAMLYIPPLWALAHWRGARLPAAVVIVGAIVGIATFSTVGKLTDPAGPGSMSPALAALAQGANAAIAAACIWLIAYPRSLQPQPAAEHF